MTLKIIFAVLGVLCGTALACIWAAGALVKCPRCGEPMPTPDRGSDYYVPDDSRLCVHCRGRE